jgi:Fur family ferric uptake transcriptional regulator
MPLGETKVTEEGTTCERIIGTLRQHGFRITPHRRRVAEIVCAADGHISAGEIYDEIHARNPQVNISTVYRTLEWLEKLNLVTRSDLGEGHVVYEIATRGKHHHLVCDQCGAIIEVEDHVLDCLRDLLMERYDFQAEIKHLAIHGVCSKCRNKRV